MNHYLTKLIKVLYIALVIGTPLVMSPVTSELFEFNKMLWIYLITGALLATWVTLMIVSQKVLIKKTVLDIPLLTILLTSLISTVFSIDSHTSLFGYYGRFDGGLLSLFSLITLFYVFVSTVGGDMHFRNFLLKITTVMGGIVVLLGLPGVFGHDVICGIFTGTFSNACWTDAFRPAERMFSSLGQPNWLGAYLAITIPLAFYFFVDTIHEKKKYMSLLFASLTVVQLFGLLMTRSRSSLLALLLSVALLVSFMLKSKKTKAIVAMGKKQLIIFGIAVVALFLIVGTGIDKVDAVIHVPTVLTSLSHKKTLLPPTAPHGEDLSQVTASSDIRKVVWQGAFHLFKKYPVVGVGLDTFGYAYYFTRPTAHNYTSEWDYLYNRAHNEYLNQLATTGVLGFGAHVLFIVSVIYLFIGLYKKSNDDDKLLLLALFASWISILVTNFFGFFTSSIHTYYFLLPALFVGFREDAPHNLGDKLTSGKKWLLIIPGIILLGAFIFVITYYVADTNYARAKNAMSVSNYPEAEQLLTSSLSLRNEHVYQDALAFTQANLALMVASSDKAKEEEVGKLLKESFALNARSLKASSSNLLYYRTGSKISVIAYQITKDDSYKTKSIAYLDQARKLAPTEPKLPYTQGLYYSFFAENASSPALKKEYAQSGILALSDAIKLKKNYREAWILKANLYEMVGDTKSAREAYQTILNTINKGDKEASERLKRL